MRLRKPQLEVAEFTNVAVRLLEAALHDKRRALTYVDSLGVIEHHTFADVAHHAAEWSDLLREHRVHPGDRVVVLAECDREWRSALLGILQAGGVAVPCRAPTPVAELRAIAEHAGAALFVSAGRRPDLVETTVLSADELDSSDSPRPPQVPHMARPGDVALILYAWDAAGLRSVAHTHASLIAKADAGEQWLGVREGERVWCTAPDGSAESIWLLLAAWREGAEIVAVDQELHPIAQFELLDRFKPAGVWFSDDEYSVLASTAVPPWVDLGSIRRALSSDKRAEGAKAFQHAFGAQVVPLFVDADGDLRLQSGSPPEIERPVADDRPTPFDVALDQLSTIDERLREEAKSRELAERAAAKERLLVEEAKRVEREAALAEERRLLEEAERAEREAARADERRRDEEEKRREEERRREAKRGRRREEQQANELRKVEERRQREEAKSRELAERAAAKERALVEEAKRAEHEAALAQERRRVEDQRRADEHRRGAEQAEREGLDPEVLSRISQYGVTARPVDPDTRRDAEESRKRAGAAERGARRDTE